jgi:two-component system phosphate regulon sensor histidine kinase PhoR
MKLNAAPGSLVPVVQRVAERMRAQASLKRITITVEPSSELPRAVFDSDRIEQVLVNLVHNALKFTPEDGDVRIRLSASDDEVMVAVEDSGPGIDPSEIDRVFERFYKADRSRTAAGSGLGLAIAKHLIQLHGGRIWAENGRGGGATFTFALPQAGGDDLEIEEPSRPPEQIDATRSLHQSPTPPLRNSTAR